jgi:hypothetical protein
MRGITAAAWAAAVAVMPMPVIAEQPAMCDGAPAAPAVGQAKKAAAKKQHVKAINQALPDGKAVRPSGKTNPRTG